MKVAFYLQRNWALVGDALAATLRDEYGVKEFCGYVSTRTSYEYLLREGHVRYTELVLDEDVFNTFTNEAIDYPFLERFEKEYGLPNLWPYLTSDRILMSSHLIREYPFVKPLLSHEDTLRVLQVMAKRIIRFLDEQKPDAVVFSVIGSIGSNLLYHIAKKKGIKTLVVFPCLFQDRYLVSKSHDRFSADDLPSQPSEQGRATARAFIEEFRSKPRPYIALLSPKKQHVSRASQLKFLLPHRFLKSVGAIVHEVVHYRKNKLASDYSTVKPYNFVLDRLKRKLRNVRGVSDLYDRPMEGEKYAFFPLQYEPEVSLSVQAPFVTDQVEAARIMARSLPVGWSLYVKEHPQMVEYRPRSFYERLKKIPNVKLINPAEMSFGLTAKSQLVMTISGTVGFEASLIGKPVVTLGNQFLNDFSFVAHCSEPAQLPHVVHAQVHSFDFKEDELIDYLGRIVDASVSVDMVHLWYDENDKTKRREGLRPLAGLIEKQLRS